MIRYSLALVLLCLCSPFLRAQETYQMEHVFNTEADSAHYDMYQVDFFTNEATLLFSLDTSRIEANKTPISLNGTLLSTIILDFEFAEDRNELYLLEYSGDIFKYYIAEDSLVHEVDVTPLDPNYPDPFEWDYYNQARGMLWVDEVHLYIFGSHHSLYNTVTKEVELIYRPATYDELGEPQNEAIAFRKCIRHLGMNLCLQAAFYPLSISVLDFMEPLQSTPISDLDLDEDEVRVLSNANLVSYQFDCDSTVFYVQTAVITLDTTHHDWYIFDPDDGSYTYSHPWFSHSTEFHDYNYSLIKNYNPIPEDNCLRTVDLDADDDTAPGLDFELQPLCLSDPLHICDLDVDIIHHSTLDSLSIRIVDPLLGQSLSALPGNYTIAGNLSTQIWLIASLSSSNSDLETGLQNIQALLDHPLSDTLTVQVIPYADGLAGTVATARLLPHPPQPSAGPDSTHAFCDTLADRQLIDLLHLSADTGGQFWDSDFNPISESILPTTPDSFGLFYTVHSLDGCADTSYHLILYRHRPALLHIPDTVLCFGESLPIDLSGLTGDILWMDGSTQATRLLSDNQDYSLSYTDTYGCTFSTAFYLTILPPPLSMVDTVSICLGDTFFYLGMPLTQQGAIVDTFTSQQGCDSLYSGVVVQHPPSSPLLILGDTAICEGQAASWQLSPPLSDLTVNGMPASTPIPLDSPSVYTIRGLDDYGCNQMISQSLTHIPAPSVSISSSWDTLFAPGLSFMPIYSGDISSYQWSPPSSLSCSNCPFPDILQPLSADYQIRVVNDLGCADTAFISVRFRQNEFFFPNVIGRFSPHPSNQSLFLQAQNDWTYDLQVFDRWGRLVFDALNIDGNSHQQGWVPDAATPSGVYIFRAVVHAGDQKVPITGDVTVL